MNIEATWSGGRYIVEQPIDQVRKATQRYIRKVAKARRDAKLAIDNVNTGLFNVEQRKEYFDDLARAGRVISEIGNQRRIPMLED